MGKRGVIIDLKVGAALASEGGPTFRSQLTHRLENGRLGLRRAGGRSIRRLRAAQGRAPALPLPAREAPARLGP